MRKIASYFLAVALVVGLSLGSSSARSMSASDSLLQSLPDGGFVFIADIDRVVRSSFWSTLTSENRIRKGLDDLQYDIAKIGLRLEDVHAVAAVFSALGKGDPVVVISGSFSPSDMLARLRADTELRLTMERYKNFDVYEARKLTKPGADRNNESVSFVFYDANTASVGSAGGVRASIDARLGARPNITQNAKLGSVMAQNYAAPIRFAIDMNRASGSALRTGQIEAFDFSAIKLIFGTVDFTSSVDIHATLRSDAAEAARAMADQLNGLLGMARAFIGSSSDPKRAPIAELLKTVSVSYSDTDVKIIGSVTSEMLTQFLR